MTQEAAMKSKLKFSSSVIAIVGYSLVILGYSTAFADRSASGADSDYPPIVLDSGGPDGYGYYYIDSNDDAFNAPEYGWIDIQADGEDMGITGDDDTQGPFPIGFTFNFYGNDYSTFFACSNGFASFTSDSHAFSNDPIPDTDDPNDFLAVFWDDLHPRDTGHAYYWSNNVDSCIIAWYNFQRYSGEGTYTFEIILTADGEITYQYAGLTGILDSHTIGIENIDGSDGLQYVYDTDENESTSAIRFSLTSPEYGPTYDVLIVAADAATYFSDELQAFRNIGDVEYFNARNATPSLSDLEGYDAVVVWSNSHFADAAALGDVLADYLDEGGGVVLQQFCFGTGWNIEGRLMSEYCPFTTGAISYADKDLGGYDPGHPLMAGVSSLTDLYASAVALQNDPILVASYTDGTPLAAYNPSNKLVALNTYVGDSREFSGDVVQLSYNAIKFAGKGLSDILLVEGGSGAENAEYDLTSYSDIDAVDMYDGSASTPSLQFLELYSVVVVWSDFPFQSPSIMGNRLADYVDSGGGVLLTQFCFGSSWELQGRIMDSYSPFAPGQILYNNRSLGNFDSGNPLMANVSDVTEYYASAVTMDNGGISVASWNDDTPFVAYNPDHDVVALNGFIGDPRQFTGDMMTIVYNAINYLMGNTAVDGESSELPRQFSLAQNYPNPFNPTTKISFELPVSSNVELDVFDILGRRVAVLAQGKMEAGRHSIDLDASSWATGMYFYRLNAGDLSKVRKMVILK